jgi:hypothetical protein
MASAGISCSAACSLSSRAALACAGSVRWLRDVARLDLPVDDLPWVLRFAAARLLDVVDRLVDALLFGAARLLTEAPRFAEADRLAEARLVELRRAAVEPCERARPFAFARLFAFALVAMGFSLAASVIAPA